MSKEMNIIEYNSKYYIWDEKKKQIRNIEDPSDFIMFQDLDLNKVEGI